MNEPVYILGGGRTDFKRNLKKEGKTIRHLIIETGKNALDDAKIDAGEIQAGAVGNFNSGQFTKQLQLGALEIESARANAGRRSNVRLRFASFGQEPECGAAAESFRLLADHRRVRWARSRFGEISGKDRPRQKENAAIARVWSRDRLFAAR